MERSENSVDRYADKGSWTNPIRAAMDAASDCIEESNFFGAATIYANVVSLMAKQIAGLMEDKVGLLKQVLALQEHVLALQDEVIRLMEVQNDMMSESEERIEAMPDMLEEAYEFIWWHN